MFPALIGASLDPLTNGHMWMIRMAVKRFDLHLAIAVNPAKKYTFTEAERQQMVIDVLTAERLENRVHLHTIADEYLVDFAESINVNLLLRGIRDEADFRYERNMRNVNAKLKPNIDTFFVMPPQELEYVSSSFVKGMCGPKGWEKIVHQYVPIHVYHQLLTKFNGTFYCLRSLCGAALTPNERRRVMRTGGSSCDKCVKTYENFMLNR